MRPAGEISLAILGACERLVREEAGQLRGPTLREMAQHAQVGLEAARSTVRDLRRAGKIMPVAERVVSYRNRPVSEYAPKHAATDDQDERSFWDVATVVTVWNR